MQYRVSLTMVLISFTLMLSHAQVKTTAKTTTNVHTFIHTHTHTSLKKKSGSDVHWFDFFMSTHHIQLLQLCKAHNHSTCC